MKELQAKAKVTQTMTRNGLMVENQADGTVENVSSREAEQDYSTDAEGKTEKILERTEDVKDKHKAKKKAKQAAETAESEDGLHRSAARLELTEEERADPALQPYIQKAEAKADKLDAARAALPKKRVPVKEKVYDAANGKAKSTLRFEQQDKGPPSLKPNPASRPLSEALLFAHGKIHEVEHENVGVEGGHKGEELVEHQTAKVIRSGIRHHKMKPYKAVEKAERQLMSANAEYFYQKSLRDNPQIAQAASNPISRMWQKRRIKQQYAKAARQAGQAAAQGAAATAENGFRVTKFAAEGGERVALQRMRLPQAVTIPLVVMFRYIPTLRIEYRQIRSTMDIRGISDTVWKRVCHPLATIEYILIPLLMRCLKVTDELAASGTTRGLELECKRYALRPIRFAWPEIVVSLLGILFLVGLLFIDQTQIGKIILWRV